MRRGLVLGAAALLVIGAACSSDDGGDAGGTTTSAEATTTTAASPYDTTTAPPPADDEDLPPAGALDLEPLYGEALADLGLELTARGGLIDRTGGGYTPSATGRHLALYVRPIGDRTDAEYVEGIRTVAIVFDDVFERWPGLESYDVCQEPIPDPTDEQEGEPLPMTQIELTRGQAEAIDLATVTVVELLRLSRLDPPGLHVRVGGPVAQMPEYQAALAEAREGEG